MAAELDIVNATLAMLGQEPVLDLGSASLGQSNAALKVTRQLNQVRDVVLRRHGWLCALTYATLQPSVLPALVASCNARWPVAYLLPSAALRVWSIGGLLEPDWSAADWAGDWRGCGHHDGPRWETGTIDTDIGARQIIRGRWSAPLDVAYVRTPSWQAIDPHVSDAISAELAYRACRSVTAEAPGADMKSEAGERLQLAVSVDGTQASPEQRPPSRLAMLRHWGGC
ncbi:hypothetical protein [Caulobacter sp. S45]|uniref:hypothetical protein n=1 Tax=Caulobacter sp. S45 TaxID=1641861 RepID=UPI001577446D|nr:hypothetical protein [Caulobacter sp. S45]